MLNPVVAAVNSVFIQRLLGIPSGLAGKLEATDLSFAARWQHFTLIGLIVVAFVWFTYNYWKDGARPSWWVKGPLVSLRLLAVVSLLAMLAQPILRLRHIDTVRPGVAILVDTSGSMARPDPRMPSSRARLEAAAIGVSPSTVPAMTRIERIDALLNRSGVLQKLATRYNVHFYTFASGPHSIRLPGTTKLLKSYRFVIGPDVHAGESTQIGGALHRAMDDLAGQPTAGMLVISDGGNNLGEDPIAAADSSRQARIPVSAIGIGDPTKTKDVALLSVLADDVVRVNNDVAVYASIMQRGYAGKTISVTLQRGSEVVGRQMVRLGPDDQKQEVRFNYVPNRGGRFYYTVTAAVQPGEVTAANNKRTFVQSVISKKLKVLYLEGEPRYEFRYLKNAILRDTSLDFACLLLSADDASTGGEGNVPIKGFPQDEKSLFDYDIVVLGDVPRAYFSDTQLEALRRFVEDRGASLLVIAGQEHMPQEYAGTPLEAVLPAVISADPNPILTDDPFQWQLTPEGRRSPIMQLEDDPTQNARVWAGLPGMFWAAGVERAKPGATVLAVHPARRNAEGPYPLVLFQPFGAGKCYMELVDSTWRWRWRVGDRYFYRYWGQVFRTLTPRELPGNSRFVQLNADRTNYLLGDRVALNARLLDAYYHPIKAAAATAAITYQNGQVQHITLQGTPGSPGLFTTQFQPDAVGKYEVSLVSPANPDARATTAFVVESLALERQKPELDEKELQRIAAAGGGRYYEPDRIQDWIRALPDNPLAVHTEQEIELWDSPLFLILFVLPLAIEWFVRKRKGML